MCKHPPVEPGAPVPGTSIMNHVKTLTSTSSAPKSSVPLANRRLSGSQSSHQRSSPVSSREQSPNQESGSVLKSKKLKKSACPCGGSSAEKDWLFKCCECNQHWHASCGNLKGTNGLNQATMDKISKEWMCPLSWVCPFAKPRSHSSHLNENSLLEKTLTCFLLQKLTDSVAEGIEKSTLPPPIDLSGLESQLENLSKEPYEVYKEHYLSQDQLNCIADLVGSLRDGGDFISESRHNVVQLGEPYGYTGSKSLQEFTQIPPELSPIIKKHTTDLSIEHEPNSVLINHYPSYDRLNPSQSHLAKHLDDEPTLLAGSNIITISVGSTRKVLFEAKHNDSEKPVVLEPQSNSLYVMQKVNKDHLTTKKLRQRLAQFCDSHCKIK
ncbi:hypothetical protein ACHWQZ_G010448 [Mnemiopsis leidyi]